MKRLYSTHDAAIDAEIRRFVTPFTDSQDRELLKEMMVSVYRLGKEQASTGDLKIINSALKELRYAFQVFRPYRHFRKVAMFGSARVTRDHPAYAIGLKFGRLMAKAGWGVITGAASGIMRAGHEGAGRAASFGLNIRLPFEQEANPVIAEDKKLVTCKYFFTRKLLFIKESHATALFPGGYGTLDEGFESMTLVQTGKSDPRPIVFVETPGGTFWRPLIRFINEQMVRGGMIAPSERDICFLASSAEEAAEHVLRFYSVYHSLRYVGQLLAIRLNRPLPAGATEPLTEEFRDILSEGQIREGRALPEETDEPELIELPRLIMAFNRKGFGRLMQLIHRVNALGHGQPPPRKRRPS